MAAPAETEIAEEVFQEGSSEPGHQGSRVRVGVYRLRKKLDLFYIDKPGKRLTIRQGEYCLLLETPSVASKEEKAAAERTTAPRQRFGRIGAALLIVLLFNAAAALLYLNYVRGPRNLLGHSELWRPFSGGKNPTFIVIGDYFMFLRKQKSDGSNEVIQDFSIESSDSFMNTLQQKFEMRHIFNNEDLYSVSSDILKPISNLSYYLSSCHPSRQHHHHLDPDMMKSSGIIYVGALDAISPQFSQEHGGYHGLATCCIDRDASSNNCQGRVPSGSLDAWKDAQFCHPARFPPPCRNRPPRSAAIACGSRQVSRKRFGLRTGWLDSRGRWQGTVSPTALR